MEEKIAREYLTDPEGKKLSEVGEAVDILYQKYGSYKAIAEQIGDVSDDFLTFKTSHIPTPVGYSVEG